MNDLEGHSAPFPQKLPLGVLAAGVIYVACVRSGDRVFRLYGIPYFADAEYMRHSGAAYLLAHGSLGVLPLVIILLCAGTDASLARSLKGESLPMVTQTLIGAVCVGFFLDFTGLWSWLWRWQDAAFVFGVETVAGHAWGAIPLTILVFGVLFPVIEEVVFRYGLLMTLFRMTGSRVLAAIVSSLIFTILHFGFFVQLKGTEITHAVWLFAFGVALSALTFARSGRIMLPIAVHVGRNIAEQCALFLWVLS